MIPLRERIDSEIMRSIEERKNAEKGKRECEIAESCYALSVEHLISRFFMFTFMNNVHAKIYNILLSTLSPFSFRFLFYYFSSEIALSCTQYPRMPLCSGRTDHILQLTLSLNGES